MSKGDKQKEQKKIEIDQELYVTLAKMRNSGSSKNRLVEFLETKDFTTEDASSIAQDIDEDFRDYKRDEGLVFRKYAIITVIVGIVTTLIVLFWFNRIHLVLMLVFALIAGYFYNKHLVIKRAFIQQ